MIDPARTLVVNVNDNAGARYLVTRILKMGGFEVVEASTGAEALALAESLMPAAMILDIRLPDIDGFEVCRRIKGHAGTARIKVLHTSATYVSADKKVDGLEAGGDAYLTQPFESAELLATLRALLRLTHTEQELRDRADRLVEADRRKDEFLAMLAHELRNPLAAISNALQLLDVGATDAARRARAHEAATRQTQHLARLIDDLLDVSRVTHGRIDLKPVPIDLRGLLTQVVASMRTRAADLRQQTIVCALPERPLVVRGDAMRLEQVFLNLLDNASKYTDEGGRIDVLLRERNGWVSVIIKDSGIGIAPDQLEAIFTLFAQGTVPLARSRGGLGIGLTLARTLAELHGGRVMARSPGRGAGSEFEVELPLVTAAAVPASAAAEEPRRLAHPASSGRRVLVVEDNPDTLETMVILCESFGHTVMSASDGLAGVEKALTLRPDVAIIDVGLPGIDGYELARRIRRDPRCRELFLVALSGYGTAEHQQSAFAAGFDDYVVKPIAPEQLRTLLSAGRTWRAAAG